MDFTVVGVLEEEEESQMMMGSKPNNGMYITHKAMKELLGRITTTTTTIRSR
jgi:hypothetical protein